MKTPKNVETHVWRGGIPLESRYTAGLGGQVFFQALKERGEEPAGMAGLVQRMVVDRSTLTRNLKPLEAAGLVRVTQPAGRRGKVVRLTAKGRRKLTSAVPLWEEAQALFVESIGAGRWKGLLRGLSASVAAKRAI